MFAWYFRVIWRILILALGVVLAFGVIDKAFPYLDHYLPMGIVFLILYVIVAYAAIPFLIRLWRIVIKPNHIPLYVVTSDGWPADPVNIAVISRDKEQLIHAMEDAGWHLAEKRTFKTSVKLLFSIITDKSYPTAPFTRLYLFNREFDLGFQKPRAASGSARARHHVRFWHLDEPSPFAALDQHHEHFHFWKQVFHKLTTKKQKVWVGAAIDDTGPIGIHWRNFQITHKNDPDINRERDLIIQDLDEVARVRRQTTIQASEPFNFYGQTIGNRFICDGQIKVVELRSASQAVLHSLRRANGTTSRASTRKSPQPLRHSAKRPGKSTSPRQKPKN